MMEYQAVKKAALENTDFFIVFLIKLNYVKFFPGKTMCTGSKESVRIDR